MTHLLMLMQTAAQTATDAAHQVAVGAVTGPGGDATEVVPFLSGAAAIMYVQRWLKSFDWYAAFVRAVPGADKWANRIVAGVGSLIVALGIHWAFSGNLIEGGTLTVQIPKLVELSHGFFDWGKLYVLQQWAYESTSRAALVAKDRT